VVYFKLGTGSRGLDRSKRWEFIRIHSILDCYSICKGRSLYWDFKFSRVVIYIASFCSLEFSDVPKASVDKERGCLDE
jgi:hypothetical protein